MKKTIDEMRAAVLAECERLCPDLNQVYIDPIFSLVNRPVDDAAKTVITKVWEFIHPNFTFLIYAQSPFMGMTYRLLGLETRDAVEAKNAELAESEIAFERQANILKAERDRSAKLVKALDEIHNKSKHGTNFGKNHIHFVAKDTLEAHKKGGVQG